MANFTAADVKKLRELTAAGMMDCKKALDEADGDFDAAVDILRTKGAAKANEDGSGPEGFEIKGNADSMKFHAPTSPWYDSTKAEVWFRSAEAAEGAGFVNAQENAQENAQGNAQTSDDTAKD